MFLTRCRDTSKKNTLYFTSKLVRNLICTNADRVKIINAGVKAFAKCENKGALCNVRLSQEGALMTLPFFGQSYHLPNKERHTNHIIIIRHRPPTKLI